MISLLEIILRLKSISTEISSENRPDCACRFDCKLVTSNKQKTIKVINSSNTIDVCCGLGFLLFIVEFIF